MSDLSNKDVAATFDIDSMIELCMIAKSKGVDRIACLVHAVGFDEDEFMHAMLDVNVLITTLESQVPAVILKMYITPANPRYDLSPDGMKVVDVIESTGSKGTVQ